MRVLILVIILLSMVNVESIDFETEIKPLLENNCIKCHGATKQKADLRLDNPDFIRKGGKSGMVVLAEKPEQSEMLIRIKLPVEDDDAMPGKGKKLRVEEIELIEKWIAQGADLGDGKKTPSIDKSHFPVFAVDKVQSEVQFPDPSALEKLKKLGAEVKPVSSNGALVSVSLKFSKALPDENLLIELCDNVVWLNLSNQNISSSFLSRVGRMKNLERVSLQNATFKEDDLKNLISVKKLRYLNLYNTNVSDSAVIYLEQMKNLENLILTESKISNLGFVKLSNSLPGTQLPGFVKH